VQDPVSCRLPTDEHVIILENTRSENQTNTPHAFEICSKSDRNVAAAHTDLAVAHGFHKQPQLAARHYHRAAAIFERLEADARAAGRAEEADKLKQVR
jgi:hypothetical protein